MNFKTFNRVPALAALVFAAGSITLAAGCQSDNNDQLTNAEEAEVLQNAKLGGIPPEARQNITAQLGDVQIASSDVKSTDAGVMYKVTYIQDGKPSSAMFDSDGNRVNQPTADGGASLANGEAGAAGDAALNEEATVDLTDSDPTSNQGMNQTDNRTDGTTGGDGVVDPAGTTPPPAGTNPPTTRPGGSPQ